MEHTDKKKRERKENPHHDDGFSLGRPSYKNKGCRRRLSAIHHVRFKDGLGIWRRLPLFTDYQSSASFARKIVKLVSLRAAGETPDSDLSKWADQIEPAKRDKLFSWGVIERRRIAVDKPLAGHLDDWRDSILAEGRTSYHARQRYLRAKRILLDECGYVNLTEIVKLDVTKALSRLKIKATSKAEIPREVKTRTRNHHASALRQFGQWLVDNDRISRSPLEKIINVPVTDEQLRRSLTEQQLVRLLKVAMDGPPRKGMTGWERSCLYHLASETGYRAAELRSLTAGSFSLDTEPAFVALHAGAAKNKRHNRLSITDGLASRMRELLQGKAPAAPAFYVPSKTAEMLRFDLARAGIPYIDDRGEKFDFHSLRVQLAASMVRGGVHVRVMQERMRHSTSKLTLDVYSRLSRSEQDATAVEALPRLALGA